MGEDDCSCSISPGCLSPAGAIVGYRRVCHDGTVVCLCAVGVERFRPGATARTAPRSPRMFRPRPGGFGGQEASIHVLHVFRASFQKSSTRSNSCHLLGDPHNFHTTSHTSCHFCLRKHAARLGRRGNRQEDSRKFLTCQSWYQSHDGDTPYFRE